MLTNKQIDLGSANELTKTTQQLSNNLQSLAPNNSELTQTITYTLIATAIVGIMVYHYIKSQEDKGN